MCIRDRYINGPWGRGQHKEGLDVKTVRIPAGPQGNQATHLNFKLDARANIALAK